MHRTNGFGLAMVFGGLCLAACGGEDAAGFDGYGTAMPGSALPEGGEILVEKILLSPNIAGGTATTVNTFHAFQYGGAFTGATMMPAPGQCSPFVHPVTFPAHDLSADADYVDWGASITLSGPGLGAGITIPKVVAGADGLTDNRPSPVRHHRPGKWIYGGPAWQTNNFQNVDLQEGEYTVDIGLESGPLQFNFPPATDLPLNVGTVDVQIPRTAPAGGYEITWEELANPDTPHSREHTFSFVAFAQFPSSPTDRGPTPLFLCQPPDGVDGRLTVPQSVLDALPEMGIIQAGRLTHYMEAMKSNDGEDRRLDVMSIYCSVSTYTKM